MQYTEFIHPEDAAALKALKAIPMLSTIVKKVMDVGAEQLQTGLNMASKVKLSPTQLPRLYNILPPICERLEIKEPEFYLEMNPSPNAYAFGDTQTAITITSALVDMMSEDELIGVVAHECGHIACRHMLYHTLAQVIVNASGMFETLAKLAVPIHYALMYWQRKIKEATTAKAAKHYSTKIRKAYAKKAAHRVLGKRLWYLPFVFAVMWRRIYAMSEEVSSTINSLNALCAFEKDFYLANLGTSKQALALSMKQVGKAVEQRQERMESAISMLEKDASPKKEEGNKS